MKSLTHYHHIVLLLSDGLPHSTLEFLTGDMTVDRPPMSCYSQRIGDMKEMGIKFHREEMLDCRGSDYQMVTPASRAWRILNESGKVSNEAREVLGERYHVWIHRQSVGKVVEHQIQFSFLGGV